MGSAAASIAFYSQKSFLEFLESIMLLSIGHTQPIAPSTAMTPKKRARQQIDLLLQQSGWIVQDRSQINLAAGPGVAIREAKRRFFAASWGDSALLPEVLLPHDCSNAPAASRLYLEHLQPPPRTLQAKRIPQSDIASDGVEAFRFHSCTDKS
jgi:hypothetical protein